MANIEDGTNYGMDENGKPALHLDWNKVKQEIAGHTPGPWYTRHGQVSSETSAHGCTIAHCNATSRGISDVEVEANARLIALAPEMAEEIERMREREERLKEALQEMMDMFIPLGSWMREKTESTLAGK